MAKALALQARHQGFESLQIYMEKIEITNHWPSSKWFPYRNHELCKDGEKWWINVGYHMPLIGCEKDIKKLLAISGYEYCRKFN